MTPITEIGSPAPTTPTTPTTPTIPTNPLITGALNITNETECGNSNEVSYELMQSHGETVSNSNCFSFLEVLFKTRISDHPIQREATGWAMCATSKGVIAMSVVFLNPALLKLANEAALKDYCRQQQEHGNFNECSRETIDDEMNLKVFGLRPSSILSASSVVVALMAAILMPILGAIIDYTSHRKTAGMVAAGMLVFLNASQITLSSNTWPILWLAHGLSDFLNMFSGVVLMTYMQNLTTDQHILATYSSRFGLFKFVSMSMYLITMVSLFSQFETLATARFAHMISTTISFTLFGYSWTYLFAHRPALHDLEPGESLVLKSFFELRLTAKRVWKSYPALKWFLITLLWSPDAESGSGTSIITTFETEFLKMSSSQIGKAFLLTLVCTIPGTILSRWLCHNYDALTSFRLCLLSWSSITAFAAWIVRGPDQVFPWFYLCLAVYGICLGWLMPTQQVLYCTLIPTGQETEMMGLLLCFHSILQWLPSLLFTVINEAGLNMRLGLLSKDIFFFLALISSIGIGDYNAAVQEARNGDKLVAVGGGDKLIA